MRLMACADAAAVASAAADRIEALLRQRPEAVLGLATGRTMEPLYAELRRRHRQGLSFAHCTTFNLDEYYGLPADSPHSFRAFMQTQLFGPLGLDPSRTHLPDPETEGRTYEAAIQAAGGIDLQVLGLGSNGHIGFNEPGSRFDSRTRRIELDSATRLQNASQFAGELTGVPTAAITMGIGTILEAREILLLVTGQGKAEILRRCRSSSPQQALPATALHLHPGVTLYADTDALGTSGFDKYCKAPVMVGEPETQNQ